MNNEYELVRLGNGSFSIRSTADRETFHPVAGPVAEAEALYIRQLRLRERVADGPREFVIWDVGLGAGGNVLTAIRQLRDLSARLHIVSFDRTLKALRFAVHHARALQFPMGLEGAVEQVLERGRAEFQFEKIRVTWEIHLGEFPSILAGAAAGFPGFSPPHAVFFDAFSPSRNPEMWTLPLFQDLFRSLSPEADCTLATFSRSTLARTALLLAGFFVGAGDPVAGKEETTIAANRLELLARPLAANWLERAMVSRSAEPLESPAYAQRPLSAPRLAELRAHPQFRGGT